MNMYCKKSVNLVCLDYRNNKEYKCVFVYHMSCNYLFTCVVYNLHIAL